ncbi:MAG: M15 family metallopeptidase [Acidobacteriaceae bacterium]
MVKPKFADASKYGFLIEPRYYYFGWSNSPKVLGRPAVLEALVKARALLPKGYNFKIWDLMRPRPVQQAMLYSFCRRIKRSHPDWSQKQIWTEVYKFGARPLKTVIRPDCHRNGGAVDLTIVDRKGEELYMGTDHDDLTDKAATDFFENKFKLKPSQLEARNNRRLLKRALEKNGFSNYSREWWHWSIED